MFVIVATNADAVTRASFVLLDAPSNSPSAKEVSRVLAESLDAVGVKPRVVEVKSYPSSRDEYLEISAVFTRKRPGHLGVAGWRCTALECELFVVEAESSTFVVIPVVPGTSSSMDFGRNDSAARDNSVKVPNAALETNDDKLSDELSEDAILVKALAAVIREMLYGNLLSELPRIASHAAGAQSMPPLGEASHHLRHGEKAGDAERSLLKVEAGYSGGYSHPLPDSMHGIFGGVALYPSRYVNPAIHLGWRGVTKNQTDAGKAILSTFPLSVAVRFAIPMEDASFLFGPVGVFELAVVYKNKKDTSTGNYSQDGYGTHSILKVGGMLGMKFAMPGNRIDLLTAAKVVATAHDEDVSISGETMFHRTNVNFVWYSGLSF